MYHELTSTDLKKFLNVKDDYQVDALVTYGIYTKLKGYEYFQAALDEAKVQTVFEVLDNDFFREVKTLVTPYGRVWFDAVYGCAYASELAHVACLLGAKAIIHVGSFGALQSNVRSGDIAIPKTAFGDESATRMYSRGKKRYGFFADENLRKELIGSLGIYDKEESVVSVQAMLAETRGDIDEWQRAGHVGVEMECATLFSVASHFKVPAAAALYAADNLVSGDLVTDIDYIDDSPDRVRARQRLFEAVLKITFDRMQKKKARIA